MYPAAPSSSSSHTTPKPSLIPQKRSLDTSADEGIRCKCRYKHDDGFSIGCDECERWCHGACFGIFAGINEPEHWLCWECEKAAKAKHKRRKSSPLIVVDDQEEEKTYVSITQDTIAQVETRDKLREHASSWRGVTALSPSPSHLRATPDSNSSILPPSYTLHTSSSVAPETYLTPYPSSITSSASYLADPLNAYAHLGMPKPFVHLLGPPLDVALDTRISGGQSRWVRSGCRPNAVLRPMLCEPSSEQLSFGLFATRALEKDEEIVLAWEWDDGNVVHQLPALLSCPDTFKPMEKEHIKKQMRNVVHALESTFAKCACGKATKEACAVERMKRFVDGEEGDGHVDLGPLVGKERGFRTQEKVPCSGGMGGVEMLKTPGPVSKPQDIVPPKMRKGSLRMFGQSPTSPTNVTTSPSSAFASLSLASPFVHTQPPHKQRRMDVDGDTPSTPSLIFTDDSATTSPSFASPPTTSLPTQELAHKDYSPPSIPAAFSRRRNSRAAGVHFDVEMVDVETISPQTVPINLSPQSPTDIPTPRSLSAPRSVQLDSNPPSPNFMDVDLPAESKIHSPRPTCSPPPGIITQLTPPAETRLLSPAFEDNSPLLVSPQRTVLPESYCRSSVAQPVTPSPTPPPDASSRDTAPALKSPGLPSTSPINRPNENSPPASQKAAVKKLTFKDYARRRQEQREKEQQDRVLGGTVNFHTPSEPPAVTSIELTEGAPPLEGNHLTQPSEPASSPPRSTSNWTMKDALPPELQMDRNSLLSPTAYPHAQADCPVINIKVDTADERPWSSVPSVSPSFVPKAEDVRTLGRELAQRYSYDSPTPPSQQITHHLPAKPTAPPVATHLRQRSNSPLSPMGDYARPGKTAPRSISITRRSPPPPRQFVSKFSPEDGEIVQPPRYPRSMNLAPPPSAKPIPSGPRAMRGLR